jgi:stress response protein YsnF
MRPLTRKTQAKSRRSPTARSRSRWLEEELVIEKRVVVRERILVRKRPVVGETSVSDQLRRERLEVEQEKQGPNADADSRRRSM